MCGEEIKGKFVPIFMRLRGRMARPVCTLKVNHKYTQTDTKQYQKTYTMGICMSSCRKNENDDRPQSPIQAKSFGNRNLVRFLKFISQTFELTF